MASRIHAIGEPNLRVLKRSRKKLQAGDVFAMLPPDGRFLYGRVIDTDANPLGVGGAILLYIYTVRSETKTPPPRLALGDLLLPPLMTNRLPWSRGYFETVRSATLAAEDRLKQHCFREELGRRSGDWYFDERGQRLPGPVPPVGEWCLHSYRTIDDAVCEALGIPLAPD